MPSKEGWNEWSSWQNNNLFEETPSTQSDTLRLVGNLRTRPKHTYVVCEAIKRFTCGQDVKGRYSDHVGEIPMCQTGVYNNAIKCPNVRYIMKSQEIAKGESNAVWAIHWMNSGRHRKAERHTKDIPGWEIGQKGKRREHERAKRTLKCTREWWNHIAYIMVGLRLQRSWKLSRSLAFKLAQLGTT